MKIGSKEQIFLLSLLCHLWCFVMMKTICNIKWIVHLKVEAPCVGLVLWNFFSLANCLASEKIFKDGTTVLKRGVWRGKNRGWEGPGIWDNVQRIISSESSLKVAQSVQCSGLFVSPRFNQQLYQQAPKPPSAKKKISVYNFR